MLAQAYQKLSKDNPTFISSLRENPSMLAFGLGASYPDTGYHTRALSEAERILGIYDKFKDVYEQVANAKGRADEIKTSLDRKYGKSCWPKEYDKLEAGLDTIQRFPLEEYASVAYMSENIDSIQNNLAIMESTVTEKENIDEFKLDGISVFMYGTKMITIDGIIVHDFHQDLPLNSKFKEAYDNSPNPMAVNYDESRRLSKIISHFEPVPKSIRKILFSVTKNSIRIIKFISNEDLKKMGLDHKQIYEYLKEHKIR